MNVAYFFFFSEFLKVVEGRYICHPPYKVARSKLFYNRGTTCGVIRTEEKIRWLLTWGEACVGQCEHIGKQAQDCVV